MKIRRVCFVIAIAVLAVCAQAQTVVEHSLATAAAATAAGGMKTLGESVGKLMGQATKELDAKGAPLAGGTPSAGNTQVITLDSSSGPAKVFARPPAGSLKVGMDLKELDEKAGEPAMKVSSNDSGHTVETRWYGMGADTLTVKLRDGKVASVVPPAVVPPAAPAEKPAAAPGK